MNSSPCCSRRDAVRSLVAGSLLLPGILSELLADDAADPAAPKLPHFPARAKRVIFLYSSGGVSQLETFDYKPKLFADAGKTTRHGGALGIHPTKLLRPRWGFTPRGRCGTYVSDLFPNLGGCMDDLCLIRSLKSDHNNHFESALGIHTGSVSFARPSLGSWVSYGLGTFNRNLPAFVVIAPQLPYAGTQVFSNDFLPTHHQGTRLTPGPEPIGHLRGPAGSDRAQEMELALFHALNDRRVRGGDGELAARIQSFETAFRMQGEAPEAFDLSRETEATRRLYGLDRPETRVFGWQCLVARRLAERGVRFIEVIDSGSSHNWDSHLDMAAHGPMAEKIDRPLAGLVRDLKARGMLADTLLVWATEFGRTPGSDGPKGLGRGHHSNGFSAWMGGAGVKGGLAYGATNDIGSEIAENEVHVHDFHATILHLLGLDHTRLTYRHAGRDFRLTDVRGQVVHDILA